MIGKSYGEQWPTEKCPYCNADCYADFVDIGVGYQQCGPYHCIGCGASEIGPYDAPRDLSEIEKKSGWYAPNSEPGSSANVIGGKIVSYQVMNAAYRDEFFGNQLWNDKSYVEDWHKNIRKPQP